MLNQGRFKFLAATCLLGMMMSLAGCFYDSTGDMIYLVTKTYNGDKKLEVPNMKFQAILAQTVFRANRSSLDILNQKEQEKEFTLTRMGVGLELEFEYGIKHVVNVAHEAGVELRFQRLPPPGFFAEDAWDLDDHL